MSDSTDGKQHVLLHGRDTTSPQTVTNPVQVDTSGNTRVALGTAIGGERNEDSITGADAMSTTDEWKATTVAIAATTDTTAIASPSIVRAIRVRHTDLSASAIVSTVGVILFKDGSTIVDGAATGQAAGTILYDGLGGVQFRTNVILKCSSTSDTNKVEILYRPLDPGVTW